MVVGFKNTDAGIIPNDWNAPLLSEISDFENGKAHEQFIDDKGEYIVINSKFISTEGSVAKYSKANLSPLEKGNIAIVMSDIPNGKALAKCFLVPQDNRYTLNQRIGCIKPFDEIDNDYLFYKLNRNKYFLAFDSGSGQTNLKKSEIRACPVAIPPTKAEQTAIATALNDADALIQKSEQLIAKKRNIKTGAMQELLKPKEGWEVKKLGEVVEKIVGGGTPSRSNPNYWNGNIPWVTVKDFATFTPYETQEYISKEGLKNSSSNLIPQGTLITSTRMGLGKAVIYKVDVSINQDLKAIFPKEILHTNFLFYWFQKNANLLSEMGSGSTVMGLSLNDLRGISFSLPNPTEQTRIAQTLSDMDNEIQELERQLEKYKMLKQGMMQSLLTGKIRLV